MSRTASRPRSLLRPPPRRRTLLWALPAGVGVGLLFGAAIGGSAGPWGRDVPGGAMPVADPGGATAELGALRQELAALRQVVAAEAERVARLRAEAEALRREPSPAARNPAPRVAAAPQDPAPRAEPAPPDRTPRAEPALREPARRVEPVAREPAPPVEPPRRAAPEPAPPRPPPATEAALARPPPPVRLGAPRVVVHFRAGSEAGMAAAQGIAAALRDGGLEPTALRPVEGVPSQRVVRYFHAEDAGAAARLAGQLGRGWAIQDFRTYAPSPSPQLLEVWIPER